MRPEPVGVWLSDGRPARFVWRGRLYTVLSIVERPSGEPGPPPERPGQPAPGPTRWECWRVTASAGRNMPAAGYQLCWDPATDRWLLSRDSR